MNATGHGLSTVAPEIPKNDAVPEKRFESGSSESIEESVQHDKVAPFPLAYFKDNNQVQPIPRTKILGDHSHLAGHTLLSKVACKMSPKRLIVCCDGTLGRTRNRKIGGNGKH